MISLPEPLLCCPFCQEKWELSQTLSYQKQYDCSNRDRCHSLYRVNTDGEHYLSKKMGKYLLWWCSDQPFYWQEENFKLNELKFVPAFNLNKVQLKLIILMS